MGAHHRDTDAGGGDPDLRAINWCACMHGWRAERMIIVCVMSCRTLHHRDTSASGGGGNGLEIF